MNRMTWNQKLNGNWSPKAIGVNGCAVQADREARAAQERSARTRDPTCQPLERIGEMLHLAQTDKRCFPATVFYNEGWLLRLRAADWFST